MTDYAKLKELAEAANKLRLVWLGKPALLGHLLAGTEAEYIAAASPDVVLELLREIERLELRQYRQAPCHKFCEATAFEIEIRSLRAENQRLKDHIHTCSPTCTKAGCVNQRLREALETIAGTTDGTDCNEVARTALGETK